jgi:hypothetical protein
VASNAIDANTRAKWRSGASRTERGSLPSNPRRIGGVERMMAYPVLLSLVLIGSASMTNRAHETRR